MAFFTVWGIKRIQPKCLAVNASVECLPSFIMTETAVYRIQNLRMRIFINGCIRVAGGAFNPFVYRILQYVRINIQADGPAFPNGG
jgi:hypothetical protein